MKRNCESEMPHTVNVSNGENTEATLEETKECFRNKKEKNRFETLKKKLMNTMTSVHNLWYLNFSVPFMAYLLTVLSAIMFYFLYLHCANEFWLNLFYGIFGSGVVSVLIDLGNTRLQNRRVKREARVAYEGFISAFETFHFILWHTLLQYYGGQIKGKTDIVTLLMIVENDSNGEKELDPAESEELMRAFMLYLESYMNSISAIVNDTALLDKLNLNEQQIHMLKKTMRRFKLCFTRYEAYLWYKNTCLIEKWISRIEKLIQNENDADVSVEKTITYEEIMHEQKSHIIGSVMASVDDLSGVFDEIKESAKINYYYL